MPMAGIANNWTGKTKTMEEKMGETELEFLSQFMVLHKHDLQYEFHMDYKGALTF